MEAAFQREKQQRDLLEKKYARLKRRYVRLERSHNRLLTESQGKRNDAGQTSPQPGTPRSVESTPNTRTPFSVIDLTSPRVDFSSAMRIHNESRNLQRSPPSFLSRDEICAESPNSSVGSPDVSTREFRAIEDQEEKEDTTDSWLPNTDTVYSSPAPRRRLHLDFTLPTSLTSANRALSSPLQQRLQWDQPTSSLSSPHTENSTTTHSGEPRTRTRPRLGLHSHSPERTAARAYGYELEQELEPRTHHHDRYHWASDPSPEPSPVVSSPLVPTVRAPLPPAAPLPSRPRAQSDEEASIALARYLQQQENIAAYEEYEAQLLRESAEQEYNRRVHFASGTSFFQPMIHQQNIDPDNMTYEELLRLGDENGDVKKEQWRQMAAQVISSLPTHRWTRAHDEDMCIVCQYNFVPNDRAMTLPCAHVFHEDCVGGWIRENNSCPTCKREIAAV
ncbi:hypothetical protein PHMEG_00032918 [Phytophthora megakarya]|uniref:RING-type domain-containing protein n=1 Tax=Phytophthora megakarya TaxID=4795 RepID=A0A225UWW8_9STRA|nr:hypothetical protein PHMEG_00032918 [Phytophthora megakarya]